jgi:hypothetical protein
MKQHTRITVLSIARKPGAVEKMADCICYCGTHFSASASKVNRGQTRSCGCQRRVATIARLTTHGLRNTREYRAWCAMRDRCTNPKAQRYADYGGRGIKVCDRWRNSAENFATDMGPCPDGLTLERNDVNGDYEPGNCRWATVVEQNRNRRNSIIVTYQGRSMNLADVADASGIAYKRLMGRVKRGMSADDAVRACQPN